MLKKSVYLVYYSYAFFLYFSFAEPQEGSNDPSNDEKSIFESNLIVPHLLPSVPKEICAVIYKPGLIIVPGQFYFPYQIQDLPEISWDYKAEKFYTAAILGALVEEPNHQNITDEFQKQGISPPKNSWHQYVAINVRKNNLKSGTVLQPFTNVSNYEPNSTHKVVYAFVVYEQFEKIDLNLDDDENSPPKFLQRYFTPASNITAYFPKSFLRAGSFFYAVPKPSGILRDTSPVRYLNWRRNEIMNMVKPHDYALQAHAGLM